MDKKELDKKCAEYKISVLKHESKSFVFENDDMSEVEISGHDILNAAKKATSVKYSFGYNKCFHLEFETITPKTQKELEKEVEEYEAVERKQYEKLKKKYETG